MVEWEDPRISFQKKDIEPGDYVIVAFARKNGVMHYAGIIWAAKDEEEDHDIHFLCKSSRYKVSYAFVNPIHDEINYVAADYSILGVLSTSSTVNNTAVRNHKVWCSF